MPSAASKSRLVGSRQRPIADWQPDRETGPYQAINLIAGADGKLLLAGFATTQSGQDVVDVFAVDLPQSPERMLQKKSRHPVRLDRGQPLPLCRRIMARRRSARRAGEPAEFLAADDAQSDPLGLAWTAAGIRSITSTDIVSVSSIAMVGRPNVQPLVSPGLIISRPAVVLDDRLVRVAVDQHVVRLVETARLREHVYDDEPTPIGRFITNGRFFQPADDLHAREQADAVAFVVAKAADKRALELSQRRHGERRNQIAREQHDLAPAPIELGHGARMLSR